MIVANRTSSFGLTTHVKRFPDEKSMNSDDTLYENADLRFR